MDIWQWVGQAYHQLVEQQQQELASYIYEISSLACDDQHQKLDALFPVALNLAQKSDNPWLEVYFRHWHLQSQVLRRHNGAQMLPEAIDLLHFSSQADTKDCPQSICVVQDLASCYGCTDGPGYVDQRIAVCNETLSRIDAAWPCYVCICSEKNSALSDAGQYQQIIDDINIHRQQMALANSDSNPQAVLSLDEAEAYLRLNQLDKALRIALTAQNDAGGSSYERRKNCIIALIYAHRGEVKQALAVFPPFEQILLAQTYTGYFCEIFYLIGMQHNQYNQSGINQKFNLLIDKLERTGCIRETINYSYWQALLSIEREDLFSCQIAIERMSNNIPKLNKDLGASDKLSQLQPLVAALRDKLNIQDNPVTACLQQHQSLNECHNEFSLWELANAYHSANHQDNPSLISYYAIALSDNGYQHRAINIIQTMALAHPTNSELFNSYSQILLKTQQWQLFDQFYQSIEVSNLAHHQQIDYYFWTIRRYQSHDHHQCQHALIKLLELNPDDIPSRIQLYWLCYQQDQFALALEHCNLVVNTMPDNQEYHWDRVMIATAAEDWPTVRASCECLAIQLSNDFGPIKEKWGAVLIKYQHEEHNNYLIAVRTGPVSAKIRGFRSLEFYQSINDEVIFEPYQLNQLNQQDDEGDHHDSEGRYYPIFKHSKTIHKGEMFVFAIDGVYPGDDLWLTLKTELLAIDAIFYFSSNEKYHLQHHFQEPWLKAFYVYVAVPKHTNLLSLHQLLEHISNQAMHPFIWPKLAEQVAQQTEDLTVLETQAQIELDYDIESD